MIVSLKKIKQPGHSKFKIDSSYLNQEKTEFSLENFADLKIDGSNVLNTIKIECSNHSSLKLNASIRKLNIFASNHSKVSGFIAIEDLNGISRNFASIKGECVRGCEIEKTIENMSSISIKKI